MARGESRKGADVRTSLQHPKCANRADLRGRALPDHAGKTHSDVRHTWQRWSFTVLVVHVARFEGVTLKLRSSEGGTERGSRLGRGGGGGYERAKLSGATV